VDIYLESITDTPGNLVRPSSGPIPINNQPANRFAVFFPPPQREVFTDGWEKKLLFGFTDESTPANAFCQLNIGVAEESNDDRLPDSVDYNYNVSLHSESPGYATRTTVPPRPSDDHFELLCNQPPTSPHINTRYQANSIKEVDLELQAARNLPGFHPEACDSDRRTIACKLLDPFIKTGMDGCYIIRPSSSSGGSHRFTLSVTYLSNVHHVSILRNEDRTYNFFDCHHKSESLRALLDYYREHPLKSGLYLTTPVPL